MLPSTVDRVPEHTCEQVNARIREATNQRVARLAARGPAAIRKRLAEIDYEWDIERALEANAASAVLAGVALGTFVNRKLFVLPAIVGGFLLQHALQGWCPPVGLFRRLGFRTQREIDDERTALKALRGDFQALGEDGSGERNAVEKVMVAVRR